MLRQNKITDEMMLQYAIMHLAYEIPITDIGKNYATIKKGIEEILHNNQIIEKVIEIKKGYEIMKSQKIPITAKIIKTAIIGFRISGESKFVINNKRITQYIREQLCYGCNKVIGGFSAQLYVDNYVKEGLCEQCQDLIQQDILIQSNNNPKQQHL